MKRQDPIAVIAELGHITNDVRDLEVSPSRAAALQCLADAKLHLMAVQALRPAILPSVPPSATDNQAARNKAAESFRKARDLLKGIAR